MNSRELSLYRKQGAAALAAEAERQLAAKTARARRLSPRRAPGKKAKEEKRATTAERWETTKAAVRERVERERQGRCEWACPRPCDDPHHLLGGKNRKTCEAPETVAGVCRVCHRAWERNDEETLARAFAWAREHRFVRAMRAIEDRMERVVAARMSAMRLPPPADPVVGCACQAVGGLRLNDQREFRTTDGRLHSVLVCTKFPAPAPEGARGETR
jgi:hypothetical protein